MGNSLRSMLNEYWGKIFREALDGSESRQIKGKSRLQMNRREENKWPKTKEGKMKKIRIESTSLCKRAKRRAAGPLSGYGVISHGIATFGNRALNIQLSGLINSQTESWSDKGRQRKAKEEGKSSTTKDGRWIPMRFDAFASLLSFLNSLRQWGCLQDLFQLLHSRHLSSFKNCFCLAVSFVYRRTCFLCQETSVCPIKRTIVRLTALLVLLWLCCS